MWWGTKRHYWIQKLETLQEKAIRIMKFLPNNALVSKEMDKLRILELKLKDWKTLSHFKTYFLYMTALKKNEKL